MNKNRDDFSAKVKNAIARRAAMVCSNPDCGKLAIQPHSDQQSAVTTGKACHIVAASPGGPRAHSRMSSARRKDIANAIWLCSNCSDVVDKDEKKYSKSLLREWKIGHEAWVAGGGSIPKMPEITVCSIIGLSSPPSGLVDISSDESSRAKEHRILIEHKGGGKIVSVELKCQFPELVYKSMVYFRTIGVDLIFEPIWMEMVTIGSIEVHGQRLPKKWRLDLGNLRHHSKVDLRIRTVTDKEELLDINPLSEPMASFASSMKQTAYWIHGTYSWEHRDALRRNEFTTMLNYDASSRSISSLPTTDQPCHRTIVESS